jgi:predicted Co/Zn/Cd cation transporter (cation efflux family)
MIHKLQSIERQSLTVGVVANLVMALSGWATFYLSGSEALLLDGNFSFIMFLSSIAALKVAEIKTRRSHTFPFGLFITEALYSLVKGLLIGGVLLAAIIGNVSKIVQYINGAELPPLKTGPILIYSIAMVIICFGLSLFYHYQNKQVGNKSSMLSIDKSASLVDGFMSAGTGAALVIIGYVNADSGWGFLLYIGDAIMVLILACLMIKQPISIIRNAFIEMAGGQLQNQQDYQHIESVISDSLTEQALKQEALFISKTGSSYLVVISFSAEQLTSIDSDALQTAKNGINQLLSQTYPHIDVEFVLA